MPKVIHNLDAYERATRARIIQNARTTWRRTYGEIAERILNDAVSRFATTNQNSTFLDKLAVSLDTYGKLSEKQTAAYISALDKREERIEAAKVARAAKAATLKYVGTPKKRSDFTVTIKKVILIQGQAFSYYDSGISLLHIMEDAEGNKLVYRGKVSLGEEGQTITIKATVKDHREYKGEKQTILTRCTIQ